MKTRNRIEVGFRSEWDAVCPKEGLIEFLTITLPL